MRNFDVVAEVEHVAEVPVLVNLTLCEEDFNLFDGAVLHDPWFSQCVHTEAIIRNRMAVLWMEATHDC